MEHNDRTTTGPRTVTRIFFVALAFITSTVAFVMAKLCWYRANLPYTENDTYFDEESAIVYNVQALYVYVPLTVLLISLAFLATWKCFVIFTEK